MGRLIYSMSVSLDGFVETPTRSLDWGRVDEELHAYFNDQSRAMRATLYGRRMYELMMGYWPTAELDPAAKPVELEFAAIWKTIPRIVFSRTLEHVDANSRLVRTDAVEEVTRLKALPGDMDLGGPGLASTLIQAGLVDEFHLHLHPVILGAGTPFFPPLEDRINLELLGTRTFSSGVISTRYGRVAAADA